MRFMETKENGTKMLGVMLDMSRNAVMKKEELLRFARVIKKFGYDTIGLYMEDVYEVDGEPYFGHLRGRYSKAELKEIVASVKAEGMTVVPYIQTLAHLNGLFRWDRYKQILDIDDILLVDDERTYALLDKMFASLRECFECDVINIGMDEAAHVGLGKYAETHGFSSNRVELLYRHLTRVLEIARKHGFKCSMWSDMFFTLAKNGCDLKEYVPSDVTLCYWDYYSENKKGYDNKFKAHFDVTKNVAFAGGAWSWAGFAPLNGKTIDTMSHAMRSCKEFGVKDVTITMWGDEGKECSFFALLPSLCYCAEVYLHDSSLEEIKEKFEKTIGIAFDDFASLELPNRIADCKNGNVGNFGLYADSLCGKFDYHIKETDGEECGDYAKRLRETAKKGGEYAYLFESAAAHCAVLELKYSLGVKTRKAYLSGDRAELRRIADDVYGELIERVRLFGEKFRALWNKENKPFGIEVQEARIGGLIYRLQSCRETLYAYLDGKLAKIDELEQPVLPFEEGKEKTAVFYEHGYVQSITLNRAYW